MRKAKWLGSVIAVAFASGTSYSDAQQVEVFFLPADRDVVEERSVVGTSTWRDVPGVSVTSHPGGYTDYVIDHAKMLESRAREYLGSPYTHRSSVVISAGPPWRPEYLHLYLEGGSLTEALYFWFDEPPVVQLVQPEGGDESWREYGFIPYREYSFGPGECYLFSIRYRDMIEKLRDHLTSFGEDPVPRDEVTVDGGGYGISGRIGRTNDVVTFGVSRDSGQIVEPVEGVVEAVRECAAVAPVVLREFEMEFGESSVIWTRPAE